MNVESLSLDGFRNLEGVNIEPAPGVNIIYGKNAQGKTNLLEGLWLFTGGKSFRGAKDAETVGFGREFAELEMGFFSQGRKQSAVIRIKDAREAKLNGVPLASPGRLAGEFCAVVFSPAHLSLVKDGPAARRRFMDAALCQLRPRYMSDLGGYNRALKQRSALLRDLKYHGELLDTLELWEAQLAALGARISDLRARYIKKLEPAARQVFDGLSGGSEELGLKYSRPAGKELCDGRDQWESSLREELLKARKDDIFTGRTSVGPHRDDLDIGINGISARIFGSQGQQRSCVLALKLSEATVLRETTGEQPVALLDDVMSELDSGRQDYILNHIDGWQVFVTCCEPSSVLNLHGGRAFEMRGGKIIDS